MSKSLRKSLGPTQADRLYMAVATEDLLEAVSIPLRARHATFGIDYTGNTPELHLRAPECGSERVAIVDTRRRCAVFMRPKNEVLAIIVQDITRRLAQYGASLAFIVQKDCQQRRIAKLQIVADDSRHIALWLAKVPRKTRQGSIGPFELVDREVA
ncbi:MULTISPECIES: hypothetical protein [Xanthomonas]|nr:MULTISPECIES: hypothetical protein [Xanthomonas]ATS39268.1 hypothetical protein XcfCFBP6988P_14995 [Xanthomonas citri pv. phaseoli var. fuscans]ATS41925.1 hypothetical protein XcfCFBP6989P_05495 [Xanthomonas citri pv. phaseoli var. fuscans]ATS47271.1 hypothetical protein XcfCFBP6990P_11865 [Xanthomonas citri pv. phaseoli var. fuscans]ATS86350.1 hypothetical protein XcfCFBP6991P_22365 [Xanthomonas citri pv. phaseoli var. fuscans]QWN20913.1 hypothetical protein DGM98_12935 [Xanthomonas citri]